MAWPFVIGIIRIDSKEQVDGLREFLCRLGVILFLAAFMHGFLVDLNLFDYGYPFGGLLLSYLPRSCLRSSIPQSKALICNHFHELMNKAFIALYG